jgi:hypothetical protein
VKPSGVKRGCAAFADRGPINAILHDEEHGARHPVRLGDHGEPVVTEVHDDPVGPPPTVGDGVSEKRRERGGEAVERHLEQLLLLRRHVGRGLGALGQALHDGRGQRHEANAGRQVRRHGRQPGDVPRRGEEGYGVAPRRQALGELRERDHVAERQPREQHHIQLAGGGCFHFH